MPVILRFRVPAIPGNVTVVAFAVNPVSVCLIAGIYCKNVIVEAVSTAFVAVSRCSKVRFRVRFSVVACFFVRFVVRLVAPLWLFGIALVIGF